MWGDSPELAASAWILGVPHPTGYPLYMLTLRLVQCLPFGTVIFRGHLFSAICAALTCGVLYSFLRSVLGQIHSERPSLTVVPALIAALATILTPVVWSQAIVTEVYTLFSLMFVLTLWLLFRIVRDPEQLMAPFFFLIGLQLVHHRLAVFLLAAVVIVLLVRIGSRRAKWIFQLEEIPPPVPALPMLKSALWSLSPLVLLLYFPLRAASDPAINWYDPITFKRFYQLISGELYAGTLAKGVELFALVYQTGGAGRLLSVFFYYISLPVLCFSLLALPILWGWVVLVKRIPWLGLMCLLLYVVYQVFILLYPVGDQHVFLIPGIVLLAVPLAVGMASAIAFLQSKSLTPSIYRLALSVLCVCAFLPAAVRFDGKEGLRNQPFSLSNFSLGNGALTARFQSISDTSTTDYANRIWRLIPEGAPVITGLWENSADNELYPLLYQQTVEGRGVSTTIVGSGFLFLDWYRTQVNRALPVELSPRDDRRNANREEWLSETWDTLIEPCLQSGAVMTTSFLPVEWYKRRTMIERVPIDLSLVPERYTVHIPSGYVYRFHLQPSSNGEKP